MVMLEVDSTNSSLGLNMAAWLKKGGALSQNEGLDPREFWLCCVKFERDAAHFVANSQNWPNKTGSTPL
ncbi:hypothetical protein RED65_09174 [Oceanobacter sp. RED65]|uniref:Uncharacterized protein n=1 Tax=Bermanella marisrubri TaxID=207949 RepID=Q1N6P1_9GAMM|nr:hypothetical protein RED65_09174 [Oceanobacter sp. RED65] [Bermanella marisrubri]